MNYSPGRAPFDAALLAEFVTRQLQSIAVAIKDDAERVLYLTMPANQGSLTAGVSANYKLAAGNVVRISSSSTVTLTGIYDKTPFRQRTLVNVGTGVVVLKSEGAESSASYRFALPASWNLSANAAAILWYDPASARHRGLSRT